MRPPRLPSPTERHRLARVPGMLLLSCLCLVLPVGCSKQPTKVSPAARAAAESLQTREDEVTAREKSVELRETLAVAKDRDLFQKEKELAANQLALAEQTKELEKNKLALDKEIEELKLRQEAILLKEKRGSAPKIAAQRAIVIDPRTDQVLMEKNADVRGQVASTQKLMTGLIITESGNLDDLLTVEMADTICAPVRFGLKTGDQYSRRQLLTALLVKSSNDIAQALARDNAGSMDAFAEKMNAKAKMLGMTNSHFVNPNGLPIENQYSTARDMAKVAKVVDQIPDIRSMVSTKVFSFKKMDGRVVLLENTNRVLRGYPYCDGMKTGYTEGAGHCLISSGEMDGRRRIVVVLNDDRSNVWRDSQALLEWALKG